MRDFAGLLLVLICLAAAGAAMSGRAAAHAALTQALPADGAVIAIAPAELSLLATGYGKIPLAKLGLVAVLLGLAAVNRYRLTGRAGAAQPLAARQLRRMIAAGIVVALAILGTAALWRFTPPPRALAIAAAQPATLHIPCREGDGGYQRDARPLDRRARNPGLGFRADPPRRDRRDQAVIAACASCNSHPRSLR